MAPTFTRLAAAAVAAVLALALCARAASECPGGCIVATVQLPERICECVMPDPSCSSSSGAARTAAARTALEVAGGPNGGAAAAPVAQGGADCSWCAPGAYNTYPSFAACRAGAADWAPPGGAGIDAASYPAASARGLKAASKPGAAGGARRLQQSCTWPVVPPTADGVPRTACPYADATLLKWEEAVGPTDATSAVTIAAGSRVAISGCALGGALTVGSITIAAGAELVVADEPLALNVRNIAVSGRLTVGTAGCPLASAITVTVPGGDAAAGVDVAAGGALDIHGTVLPGSPTWARLAATAPAGATSVTLSEPVKWRPGDAVVLATTLWKDEAQNQNEVLTLSAVSADGKTLTFSPALAYQHYAGAEYQAEVGLLTRNILFTATYDAGVDATLGPHTTMMSPDCRISGAAYHRWAARNKPGRYSMHFHLAGPAPNAFLRNNAVYRSNWRALSVHGTNNVTVAGNVAFDVFGHAFYLEDGNEEGNVFERNLAVHVHPVGTPAGSPGGQKGTDHWAGPDLFDPTDAGASGFYALNLANTWRNNAAVGGFAGFSFPKAVRCIKNCRADMTKSPYMAADGYPFDPSKKKFIAFEGNTARSTGYAWEHAGAFYFGGAIHYRINSSINGGAETLYYNNGRGEFPAEPLCPDPNWPKCNTATDPKCDKMDYNANRYCSFRSNRNTKEQTAAGTQVDGFIVVRDCSAALAHVGIMSWGDRIEVHNFRGYDVNRGAEFLGQSWLNGSYFFINTTNSATGKSGWPWSSWSKYWESPPIQGFGFYDTMTSSLISNTVYENYKNRPTTATKTDWWYGRNPAVFWALTHSDQFKPDKTMMATRGISCPGVDLGDCNAAYPGRCSGNALFRHVVQYTGSSWQFNWLDADGSVVRQVAPAKPAAPYMIGSAEPWWRWRDDSWQEPGLNAAWVTPRAPVDAGGRNKEDAARLDMRVALDSTEAQRYTYGAFGDSRAIPAAVERIGYVAHHGAANHADRMPITRIEGTTGLAGDAGWYAVFNQTLTGLHAPKRLDLVVFNVPRERWVYWSSCWPAGTTFAVTRAYSHSCTAPVMAQVMSRAALLADGSGNKYFVDNPTPTATCLHLKVTDPGHPWEYTDSFVRDGMYIEEEVHWYDHIYTIVASNCPSYNTHFCAFAAGHDPAAAAPARAASPADACWDVPPPGGNCGSVKCAWTYWPGCSNTQVVANKWCQATCGTCPAVVATSPPPPPPSPPPPSPPPPSPPPPPCGDGVCDPAIGETCDSCPADCPKGTVSQRCGNGLCEGGNGENYTTCPTDCAGKTGNKAYCCGSGCSTGCSAAGCNTSPKTCTMTPVATVNYCCGDGVCNGAETATTCSLDCAGGGGDTVAPSPPPPAPPPAPCLAANTACTSATASQCCSKKCFKSKCTIP